MVGFGLGVGIDNADPLEPPPQPVATATQTSAKRTSVFRCADVTKRAYTSKGEFLVGKGPGRAHRTRLLDVEYRSANHDCVRLYRRCCTSTRGVARYGLPGERASPATGAHDNADAEPAAG